MEKELKRYKASLKTQNLAFALGALILLTFMVLSYLRVVQPAVSDSHWIDLWNGFIAGASAGVLALLIVGIVLNCRAIRSEAALRKQYIKEHDERSREICARSGHTSYWFDALGLLLAGIVSGYWNPVVSMSCIGCLFYICLVRLGLKLYYNKKL